MFGLFRSNKWVPDTNTKLLSKVFSLLPGDFASFKDQIDEGIVTKGRRSELPLPNSVQFLLNTVLLNQYEIKTARCFLLRGIEVFDLTTNTWVEFIVDCGYGIVMGYSTPASTHFSPDLNQIRLNGFRKQFLDEDELEAMHTLLDPAEIELINPSDFYEIELDGKTYYHLVDLEDGDFVGVDSEKRVYRFTHDPNEIRRLDGSILENLNRLR